MKKPGTCAVPECPEPALETEDCEVRALVGGIEVVVHFCAKHTWLVIHNQPLRPVPAIPA